MHDIISLISHDDEAYRLVRHTKQIEDEMVKICEISLCDECHKFDNVYYGYNETCRLLDRKIEKNENCDHDIPSDCPLTDA